MKKVDAKVFYEIWAMIKPNFSALRLVRDNFSSWTNEEKGQIWKLEIDGSAFRKPKCKTQALTESASEKTNH